LWQLGRNEEARNLFDQTFAQANQGGDKSLLIAAYQFSGGMALSQRRFKEAKVGIRRAHALAGTQDAKAATETKRLLGLVQAFSGAPQAGELSGKEAVVMAKQSGDAWLISRAEMTLAEIMLKNNEARPALEIALRAQENLTRSEQHESQWRAWLIAARASQQTGDNLKASEYALHAGDVLTKLRDKWGAEAFKSYLHRPDIQNSRKQLGQILAKYN